MSYDEFKDEANENDITESLIEAFKEEVSDIGFEDVSEKNDTKEKILYIAKEGFKFALTTFVFYILMMGIIKHTFLPIYVRGTSMVPSYESGQMVIAIKTQKVNVNDVIVFKKDNEKNLIKRVIAKGGDEVDFIDGQVYVNGELSEYVASWNTGRQGVSMPHIVEDGCVFVLGDNRVASVDSRFSQVGDIPIENIIGKVLTKANVTE